MASMKMDANLPYQKTSKPFFMKKLLSFLLLVIASVIARPASAQGTS